MTRGPESEPSGLDPEVARRLRQLSTLLLHSPDPIVTADVDGRVSEWSPAAEALLGWSRREAVGTAFRQHVPAQALPDFDDAWARLVAGEPVPPYGTTTLHRDGTLRPVTLHAGTAGDELGGFAGVVIMLRDRPEPVAGSSAASSVGSLAGWAAPDPAFDLRRGIERGELRLHYQPIVELTDNHVVGVEALVRWERPGIGLQGPAEFIDLAERSGQIMPLGAWVTHEACRVAAELAQLATGPHRVSINLSARQLSDPGAVEILRQALEASGCPASSIEIEVTETALMQDLSAATAALGAIKALGISLALDDFGTGHSSLLYLKHFPVDRIKIDQSFVRGLGADADDTAIVASTISLAHNVGVRCIAEGVETVDQLALLRQMGCDYAQGYLFSRPVTLDAFLKWLPEHLPTRGRRSSSPVASEPSTETRRILALHAAGASLHTIAAAMNIEGLRTPRGTRWTAPSVARVITRSQFPTLHLPR